VPFTLVHVEKYGTEDKLKIKKNSDNTETKHNPEQEAKLSLG